MTVEQNLAVAMKGKKREKEQINKETEVAEYILKNSMKSLSIKFEK